MAQPETPEFTRWWIEHGQFHPPMDRVVEPQILIQFREVASIVYVKAFEDKKFCNECDIWHTDRTCPMCKQYEKLQDKIEELENRSGLKSL